MKRKLYIFLTTVFMLVFVAINFNSVAQSPPHVDLQHQKKGDQPGTTGGAPIGNGTLILMVMAVAYAGRKTYSLKQQEEE